MTSGGNNFKVFFPEIVPTREIKPKQRRLFSFSRPWPWAYFLNVRNAAASIAPTVNPAPGAYGSVCCTWNW